MVGAHQHDYGDARDVVGSTSLKLSGPGVCPVGDAPTKAHADFQELVAVSKPEDGHAGPMMELRRRAGRLLDLAHEIEIS
jgi:hypothetical protein